MSSSSAAVSAAVTRVSAPAIDLPAQGIGDNDGRVASCGFWWSAGCGRRRQPARRLTVKTTCASKLVEDEFRCGCDVLTRELHHGAIRVSGGLVQIGVGVEEFGNLQHCWASAVQQRADQQFGGEGSGPMGVHVSRPPLSICELLGIGGHARGAAARRRVAASGRESD